jgi:hypothetical protein
LFQTMPHVSDLYGKYTPHNTNKIYEVSMSYN